MIRTAWNLDISKFINPNLNNDLARNTFFFKVFRIDWVNSLDGL